MKKEPFGMQYYFILLAGLASSMGYSMIGSVVVKYVVSLGYSLTLAGFVSGLYAAAALIIRPFGGILADRFNEKKLMKIIIPIFALSIFSYGLAPNLVALSLIRIISGMAFAVNGTLVTAYACRFIPNCRMGEGVGYLGLSYTISLAVSPGIGLAIYYKFGARPAFYCAGLIILLSFIFVMLIKDDGTPKNTEKRRIKLSDLASPALFPLASFNGLFALCNSIITAFIILHAENNGIQNPAVFFTVTAVAMIFIRPFAGKIGDSKGIAYALVPAFVIGGIGMLLVAYMNSFPMLIAAAILTAFASGAGQPSVQAECIRRMPESRRGVAISTYFIFADVFFGCGPLLGGALSDAKGYVFTFTVCAIILFAGLGLYMLYAFIEKRKKNKTQA